jgi:hypothetical protein
LEAPKAWSEAWWANQMQFQVRIGTAEVQSSFEWLCEYRDWRGLRMGQFSPRLVQIHYWRYNKYERLRICEFDKGNVRLGRWRLCSVNRYSFNYSCLVDMMADVPSIAQTKSEAKFVNSRRTSGPYDRRRNDND